MMSTTLPGEFKRLVGAVDHNDLGRTERGEHLNSDMSETAGADHHDIFARQQMA